MHRHTARLVVTLALLVTHFGNGDAEAAPTTSADTIRIDGSSTVYPITEAVAEEFQNSGEKAKVTVGISGTGGGFKKFCAGETEISDASRPIKQAEIDLCAANKVEYIEIPIAYDALTVVVNPKNDWIKELTVADLKKMWAPEAQEKITKWNQVRSEWPDRPLRLFGAGVDSGTYDYFTEAVVGKEHSSRGDFTSSEDDNVLVQGVSGDQNALGFFGLAYYLENRSRIKAIPIDDGKPENGAGAQLPTVENVLKGTYQPLARPLFIYVSRAASETAPVKKFVEFYLKSVPDLTKEVGYVPLSDAAYALAAERYETTALGSVFTTGHHVGVTIEDLLRRDTSARAKLQERR